MAAQGPDSVELTEFQKATLQQYIKNMKDKYNAAVDASAGRSISSQPKDELIQAMQRLLQYCHEITENKIGPFEESELRKMSHETQTRLTQQGVFISTGSYPNSQLFKAVIDQLENFANPQNLQHTICANAATQAIRDYNQNVLLALRSRQEALESKASHQGLGITHKFTKRDDRVLAIEGLIEQVREWQRKTPPEPIDLRSVVADLKQNGNEIGLYDKRKIDASVYQIGLKEIGSGVKGKFGGESEFSKVLKQADTLKQSLNRELSSITKFDPAQRKATAESSKRV